MKWSITKISQPLSKFTVLDHQTGKNTDFYIAGIDTVEIVGNNAIVKKKKGRSIQIDLLDGTRRLKSP